MIICQGFILFIYLFIYLFHFFKILIFWFVSGIKGQKNDPKWQKFLSVAPCISGIFIDRAHAKNELCPYVFSIFNFWGQ